MGDSNFRGPVNSMGSLEVQAGNAATIEPLDGPSILYQGLMMPDVRSVPFLKDGITPGRVSGFLNNGAFWAVDAKPQATNASTICTVQVATANLGMALTTAQPSNPNAGGTFVAVGVPVKVGGTTTATAVLALDFGFTTGTATANSSTIVVNDNTKFSLGQWITLGGGGGSNNSSFFTQVQSITPTNYTGITVFPLPPAATSSGPIGGAGLFGANILPIAYNFGPSTPTPIEWQGDSICGLARAHNPVEQVSRNISITLQTGGVATAVTFLVTGIDVWHNTMTEVITVPATTSATTAYGQKGFKFIQSITPTSASTGGNSYSVGIGDVCSFPFRADEWEQTQVMWAGTTVVNSTGFTAAATTAPATNTTGDVHGTVQVGAAGKGTAVTGTLSFNGTSRLAILQNVGVWNVIAATPNNTVPLFGVAQSTT